MRAKEGGLGLKSSWIEDRTFESDKEPKMRIKRLVLRTVGAVAWGLFLVFAADMVGIPNPWNAVVVVLLLWTSVGAFYLWRRSGRSV